MKGISCITDEKNNKKAVVIDLKIIEERGEDVHEFIDVLVSASRKAIFNSLPFYFLFLSSLFCFYLNPTSFPLNQ